MNIQNLENRLWNALSSRPSKRFLLVGSLAVFTVLFLRAYKRAGVWNLTHWTFDYRFGFIKRGLVGELLSRCGVTEIHEIASIIALFMALLAAVVLFALFLRLSKKNLLPFALLSILHFATIQHFLYDTGRFDHFALIIIFLCILSIEKLDFKLNFTIISLLLFWGVIIHEAILIISMPLIVAYWLLSSPKKRPFLIFLSTIPAITMCYYLGAYGSSSLSFENHYSILVEQHGTWIEPRSVMVLSRSLGENFTLVFHRLFSLEGLGRHIVLVLALSPTLLLIRRILGTQTYASLKHHLRWEERLLLLSAFSPLALYPLGIDFFRWWALAITNAFISLSLILLRSEPLRDIVLDGFSKNRALYWTILGTSILVGPLAVTKPFPRFFGWP
jgi:hypothetical protein